MREIFSVRFFAAAGAVVGLFFLLTTIFATREVIVGDDGGGDAVQLRRIDFVDRVFSSRNEAFAFDIEGLAATDTDLIIDGSRSVTVVAGTPGENHCPRFPEVGACAVVADLLGEGVVWLALVPASAGGEIDLPAIDTLDEGVATLVNGWQVPFAPALDRRCPDDDFASYRELRNVLGDEFVSIYSIEQRRLVAVECRTRVAYAPVVEPEATIPGTVPPTGPTTTPTTPSSSVPATGSTTSSTAPSTTG